MQRALHTPAYEPADLTTCDREPIHVPGAIQPHGVLLALAADEDRSPSRTMMVSTNVEELLGVPLAEAVGAPLARFVGEPVAAVVEERARSRVVGDPLVLRLPPVGDGQRGSLAGRRVDVDVHWSGERVVVELEPSGTSGEVAMSYQSARGAMARLAAAGSVAELSDQLADEIRRLTRLRPGDGLPVRRRSGTAR